jgi:DNA mismatch endonuclease (patch repair protein)
VIRSALHRAGLRFRVDHPVRVGDARPIRPDIVFTRQRVAVFVDGCFWHGCPEHGTAPKTNAVYWSEKIAANVARDARHVNTLEAGGWRVLRVWSHEQPEDAAEQIVAVVRQLAERPVT